VGLPYLSYFNLKEEPFSTVPSPRYLYLTPFHATALGKAEFVVETQKGLAVVFGDTGTGKSSLARLLLSKFIDRGFLCALITNPSYPGPYSLLRTIGAKSTATRISSSSSGSQSERFGPGIDPCPVLRREAGHVRPHAEQAWVACRSCRCNLDALVGFD
jgi:hypothetical protein